MTTLTMTPIAKKVEEEEPQQAPHEDDELQRLRQENEALRGRMALMFAAAKRESEGSQPYSRTAILEIVGVIAVVVGMVLLIDAARVNRHK
jgi:hypothetical protein